MREKMQVFFRHTLAHESRCLLASHVGRGVTYVWGATHIACASHVSRLCVVCTLKLFCIYFYCSQKTGTLSLSRGNEVQSTSHML